MRNITFNNLGVSYIEQVKNAFFTQVKKQFEDCHPEEAPGSRFNIITITSNEFDFSIKESIFIRIMAPNLNDMKNIKGILDEL